MYIVHSSLFWFFAYYYIEKKRKVIVMRMHTLKNSCMHLIILVITDIR